jgi:hypothetical protein
MKKIWNWIKDNSVIFNLLAVLAFILIIIASIHQSYEDGYNDCLQELKDKYSSPVERIVIDSFYITRDSIIERTKYIKAIQHDTIEKVYNLNADSTLDLFYKLVSE